MWRSQLIIAQNEIENAEWLDEDFVKVLRLLSDSRHEWNLLALSDLLWQGERD